MYEENKIAFKKKGDTLELCFELVAEFINFIWEDLFWGFVVSLLKNCLWTRLKERPRKKQEQQMVLHNEITGIFELP